MTLDLVIHQEDIKIAKIKNGYGIESNSISVL